jgi:hypothetical protein
MYLKSLCCLSSLATAFMAVEPALAQIPPAPYVAPAPILNPSTSLVLPPPRQVPVSPSLGGAGVFGTGQHLRGTNQVVNPPRSVLRSSHVRHYRHAQR